MLYPLVECETCNHVQVSGVYDDKLFNKLYFHSTQESVMWHESLIGDDLPYDQMIEFVSHSLTKGNTIVDFGCGEGKLLSSAKAIEPSLNLIGIDFNHRMSDNNSTFLSHDLNQLGTLSKNHWPKGIDIAMASHVLEHVINPVDFLTKIKQHLTINGQIFIEVPDFSQRHQQEFIGMSNLVNLQHIHYFTVESLTNIANKAGLKVLKLRQTTTGYIPRLKVLLSLNSDNKTPLNDKKTSARDTIIHYQTGCNNKRQKLAAILIESIRSNKAVAIWGLGADFYALLAQNKVLEELVQQGKITLFDYGLKNKRYLGQWIKCSSDIPQFAGTVYLSPLLVETRVKMNKISKLWKNTIDIYSL